MKRSIFLIACLLALKLMVSFTEAKPVAKEKVEETAHDAKEPDSQENDAKEVEEESVDDSSGSGSGDGKYTPKQYLSPRLYGHPIRDIFTLTSAYIRRKKLTPLPEPTALGEPTAFAHALIDSP